MNKLELTKLKENINEIIKAKELIKEAGTVIDNIDDVDLLLYPHSSEIAKQLNIEIKEALFFSMILGNSIKGELTNVSEVCRFFRMNLLMMPEVLKILDALEQKGLLNKQDADSFGLEKKFYVPDIVTCMILEGQLLCNTKSLRTCLKDLSKILNQVVRNPNILKNFQDEIVACIMQIQQPDYRAILDSELKSNSLIILFAVVALNQLEADDNISFTNDLIEILSVLNNDSELVNALLSGTGNLFENELIKVDCKIDEKVFFALGKSGRKILFGSNKAKGILLKRYDSELLDVIQPSDISIKKLFFDEEVKRETDKLFKLAEKNNFKSFVERMNKISGKKGLTCLAWGPPGSGKTEFAMQLAKSSNRIICKVDISSIRRKWIGESEENAKQIFKDYYHISKNSLIVPVLLFNESDALISKRNQVSSSVDMMNNSMQNIFLDELENFKGILIATTNIVSNMDSAFDRRFLYKIQFEKPSVGIRRSILRNKLPLLNEETINVLSEDYDFSGGELDNITRKIELFEITDNRIPTFEEIIFICDREKAMRKSNYSSIGFRR
ncbi:MAG TPA: ATP-binding protein [Bacteroidia bacterium]|nr:ATP-binding protein [Bacteroidia bacterium]